MATMIATGTERESQGLLYQEAAHIYHAYRKAMTTPNKARRLTISLDKPGRYSFIFISPFLFFFSMLTTNISV
ncbi:hypothetical protein IPF89_00875 [Candidatus Saccharibacteria bacterium]|nr:MAG: hypothetical protein IPF89_00875 [Candidatus Saccharibacteria bacterium]